MEAAYADKLRRRIEALARERLIDEVRFVSAENFPEEILGDSAKFAGRQPRDIMKNARSIIVVSTYIGAFALPDAPLRGRLSRLVLSGYYSNIVRPLAPVAELLRGEGFLAHVVDTDTDEIAIPIKAAAVRAGLGWIGKNTLVISKKYGSFQAFGAILTDAELAIEYEAQQDGCGACTRCRDACPAHAIDTPRVIERPRCLSNFLESEGVKPPRADTERYFFECDICQNACAFNQLHIKAPLDTPFGRTFDKAAELEAIFDLARLRAMDEREYNELVRPLIVGFDLPYEMFQRNLGFIGG